MRSLCRWFEFHGIKVAKIFYRMPIVSLGMLFFVPPHAIAAVPEISVLCGGTSISASMPIGRQLRNVRVIRITVDPANKCRVDVSIELKDGADEYKSAKIRARKRVLEPALSAPGARCFVFADRSYCE
jgi:hypothetical protein